MNFVFRLLLTINATSWMLVIYAIKGKMTIGILPFWANLLDNTVFMGFVATLKVFWQREFNNVRGVFTG